MRLKKKFRNLLILLLIICVVIYYKSNNGKEILTNIKDLKASESYIIDDIMSLNQFPMYPTGCESVSLYLLLKFYNVDVSVDAIIDSLPKGNLPYEEDDEYYGADPEKEFIGSPYNDYSYGVFEEPIRKVASKFKRGANGEKNFSIKDLKNKIKENKPVIAWIRIQEDKSEVEYAEGWISDNDYKTEVKWIKGEHAVLVYGYDRDYYYISNPYNGKKYPIDKDIFEYNYEVMGRRVVYY